MPDPAPASVPFAVVLSVLSAVGGGAIAGGIAWGSLQGDVRHNREQTMELRAALEGTSGHAMVLEHLRGLDIRVDAHDRAIADQRATRDAVVRIEANVRALCASSRASCAP